MSSACIINLDKGVDNLTEVCEAGSLGLGLEELQFPRLGEDKRTFVRKWRKRLEVDAHWLQYYFTTTHPVVKCVLSVDVISLRNMYKAASLRIDDADLKCKSGCGYYGNAEWGGYCSKCNREHLQRERMKKGGPRNLPVVDREHTPEKHHKSPIPGFTKFEVKKRHQAEKKTKLSKLFRKSKDTGRPGTTCEPSWAVEIPDLEKLKQEYQELFARVGEEVESDFQELVYKHSKHTDWKLPEIDQIADVSEHIQSLYQLFSTKLEENPVYHGVKQEDKELLLDYAEKYLMTRFYRILFCPTNTTDEEKDLAIQNRIRQLNWVSAKHLDCKIDETSPEVQELVYAAITDILGMDSAKTPQDKLNCIIRCCHNIFLLLQQSIGRTVSTDELLPAFIFVVLKANPTRLKSNINYITRFCSTNKLISGEGAYFFTLLCSAVCFIESLSAAHLNMSDEEFKQYMSGEIVPPSTWEFTLMMCEGMHLMAQHLTELKDLENRHTNFMQGTESLKADIDTFKNDILSKIEAVRTQTPLTIRPRKVPTNIDADDPNCDALPPPMVPQVVAPIVQNKINDEPYGTEQLKSMTGSLLTNSIPESSSFDYITPSSSSMFSYRGTDDIFAAQESLSFVQGLTAVNYDIDLPDSSENSLAEDGIFNDSPRAKVSLPLDSKTEDCMNSSLLDSSESPTGVLLPSPIKPMQSTEYHGFSSQGPQIPSIPCDTGDSMAPLPFPAVREVSTPANVSTHKSDATSPSSGQSSQAEDNLVKVISGVMNTLDKLF